MTLSFVCGVILGLAILPVCRFLRDLWPVRERLDITTAERKQMAIRDGWWD